MVTEKQDIIKQFGKIFKEKSNEEDIKREDLKGYMDPSNVMCIIPKKESLRTYLINNFEVEERKIPEFDYTDNKLEPVCTYSCEYMKVILEMTKNSEVIKFKLKSDYPLWAETEDIIVILAPRVVNE